jgi:hypothetical protein
MKESQVFSNSREIDIFFTLTDTEGSTTRPGRQIAVLEYLPAISNMFPFRIHPAVKEEIVLI